MDVLQMIAINNLRESQTNPRRTFKKMDDLTESVRKNGVLVPLLVRDSSHLEGYEIIAGARRYRAAVAAELDTIPAIIKEVSDEEALEIQVLENLQREDVHPLEEGDAYKSLIDRTGKDVAAIAAKVGKSETYVYQRLKLTDLIEEARMLFYDDQITVSHAILIARMQPDDQEKTLKWINTVCDAGNINLSARELSSWIENNIHLDLKRAPFKMADDKLVPNAGSCISCHKRTGFVPQLFPDIAKVDTCTDSVCYYRKLDAYIEGQIKKYAKKKQPLQKISSTFIANKQGTLRKDQYKTAEENDCHHARKAIITEGPGVGGIITICADAVCDVHWKSDAPSTTPYEAPQYQNPRDNGEYIKELHARELIYKAIAAKVLRCDWEDFEYSAVVTEMFSNINEDDARIFAGTIGLDVKDLAEENLESYLLKMIMAMPLQKRRSAIILLMLVRDHTPSPYNFERPEIWTAAIKAYDIDVATLE